MKNPLDVSPSEGNQGTTRGKEKIILTSVRIEPTTSGLVEDFALITGERCTSSHDREMNALPFRVVLFKSQRASIIFRGWEF